MRKLLIVLLISLLMPVIGYCEPCEMTAKWMYPSPPTDLSGFLLYREVNGVQMGELSANITASESFVALVDDNATYSHTGLFEMGDGANVFRLIAYDLAGQEGPISDSAGYDPAPAKKAKFILLMFGPQ